jgi:hypothetical protein
LRICTTGLHSSKPLFCVGGRVLWFELRVLCLLYHLSKVVGSCSTTSTISNRIPSLCPGVNRRILLSIYAALIARMTGAHYCTQLLMVEMVSSELFARAGLEPWSSWSLPPK